MRAKINENEDIIKLLRQYGAGEEPEDSGTVIDTQDAVSDYKLL